MNILVTGGTGFIGGHLVPFLQRGGHQLTILTRRPDKPGDPAIRALDTPDEIDAAEKIDAIINLAGAPIARRWTKAYRQTLVNSRVGTTDNLVALVARLGRKPELLISASAVGYYGAHDATPLDETATCHPGFTHALCAEWERSALRARDEGVRVCVARLGVVLGKDGGALARMLPAFRLGLGGKLGSGRQMFSWVHIEDVVRAFDFLLRNNRLNGAFNLGAPHAVSNGEFAKALGHALRRPACLPVPSFAVKLLFGEMGDSLLLKGQGVIPKRLRQAGFQFNHPVLKQALEAILR